MVLNKFKDKFWKFWKFLNEDTWQALLVSLVLAFLIIKLVLFPLLSFFTGTGLPLVIVESCSMHHPEKGFDKTFESGFYENYNLSLANTSNWIFKNGFGKGDIIFVVGPKNIKVGDVLIFDSRGGAPHPIIHRVIYANETYFTKGDNPETNNGVAPFEKNIQQNQLLGKAVFKIPYLGWIKLLFFDWTNPPSRRGFC